MGGSGQTSPHMVYKSRGAAIGHGEGIGTSAVSAYALYNDYQRGNVAHGVGDAAGTSVGVLAVADASTAAAVTGAFAVGYSIGTIASEYIIESLIDKAAPGSGALGDWYYKTFLK